MIYDITQALFECKVFPGDPKPEAKQMLSIENGDLCNLTAFSMCAHNGTHVDAPLHFLNDGRGIGEVALEKFCGPCMVVSHQGIVSASDAQAFIQKAAQLCEGAQKKILIGGNAVVSLEAAKVFAEAKVDLVGNESQTVGPEDSPRDVHLVLLGAEVVLLEGIRLGKVKDGIYYLNCAPINLGHADGAPCRAILLDSESCSF